MPNRNPGQTRLAESDDSDIQELVLYSSRHREAHASHVGAYAVNQTNYQIHNITIFNKNIQQNLDGASGTFGAMSSNGRDWNELPKMNGASDLAIDHSRTDSSMASGSARHSVPQQYVDQEQDFFSKGRYFKIWAETPIATDQEIHTKEFIMLDSSNSEGKGIRVDRIEKRRLTAGASRYSVAIIGHGRTASEPNIGPARPTNEPNTDPRFTKIYLEDVGGDSPTDRYARLDHTYNIPFTKYPCEDLGILEPDSLDQLRLRFLEYMAADWRLIDELKSLLCNRRQAGKPRGAS